MRLRNLVRPVAALALIAGLSSGAISVAWAADAIFPPSSRFGFTPASDMTLSKRFSGFERMEGGATLSIVELPSTAFVDLEKSFTDENLRTQGFVVATREAIKVAGDVDAVLFTGEQPAPEGANTPAIKKWLLLVGDTTVTGIIIAQTVPDAETPETMRNMLTSVKIRPELTLDEQVAALPFRIRESAGFRPVRVLAGNSVLMTQGPKDQMLNLEQPILVLAQAVQQPPQPEQRDAFARAALYSNQTMKDFAVERFADLPPERRRLARDRCPRSGWPFEHAGGGLANHPVRAGRLPPRARRGAGRPAQRHAVEVPRGHRQRRSEIAGRQPRPGGIVRDEAAVII